ncbi:MAG: rhodanese-like domain-containing protein [Nitrospiraceae bacterium]|nr:rhodanese-like domain-containing protein [Nitrospiraceae bacterium]
MFFNASGITNISPCELRRKMEQNEDFLLLDVRTPGEHEQIKINGSRLLPVQELTFRAGELPRNKEIVVYCRVGNRSAFAAAYLSRLGYRVKNLEGGIMSWAQEGEACGTA